MSNDDYPCGGKVEKLEWEEKHGCRNTMHGTIDNPAQTYKDYYNSLKYDETRQTLINYDNAISGLY